MSITDGDTTCPVNSPQCQGMWQWCHYSYIWLVLWIWTHKTNIWYSKHILWQRLFGKVFGHSIVGFEVITYNTLAHSKVKNDTENESIPFVRRRGGLKEGGPVLAINGLLPSTHVNVVLDGQSYPKNWGYRWTPNYGWLQLLWSSMDRLGYNVRGYV